MIGLKDRYKKGKGADKGWEGNVMAGSGTGGYVQQQNIDILGKNLLNQYNVKKVQAKRLGVKPIGGKFSFPLRERKPKW